MGDRDSDHGFLVGGNPEDLFQSTAPYYADYRRSYPEPVVDFVVRRCGLDGQGRLLDAGCGTGQVFQVFAQWFDHVLAIDRDPEMIRYARSAVASLSLTNVTVRHMPVESVSSDLGPFRMTIFGASFHWTDRPRIAELIHDLTEPGGYLMVLAPNDIPRGTTEWEAIIQRVVDRHVGTERRAGSGTYRPLERHEEALKRTRFRAIEQTDIPLVETWSTDEIVGYLFSTSFASKAVLGDRAEAFEHDVRQELAKLDAGGRFVKVNEYTVILAVR